uniref:p60 protein n=1 Tax=Little cherry virus 2 TaxID=154339 RepID=A0A290DR94_9CLOS|nr:p60 protein [Little cherry virus 2]
MNIGLDFGTTFSTAALFASDDKVETLKLFGDDLQPTYVYIDKSKNFFIGNAASAKYETNLKTKSDDGWLYKDIKRWVGVNKHNFTEYQQKLSSREYNVRLEDDFTVALSGLGSSEGPFVTVVDLIALFVRGISVAIENQYGENVVSLVCTVPADYNSYKRSFLLESSKLLDQEIIAVVNEPTAAALYSALKLISPGKVEHVIVYDFGGGTFDVSYLCLYGRSAIVLDTAGDLFLGGRDIDAAIAEKISSQIEGATARDIVSQCSNVKLDCSSEKRFVDHSIWFNETVHKIRFSYEDFLVVMEPFKNRSINLLSQLLKRNSLVEKGVNVVMVGGSSSIPLLREAVSACRGVKRVVFDSNTFRIAVAVGAKVYSDSLVNNKGLVLVDTLSHAILDEVVGLKSKVVVGKGQVVPSTAEVYYGFSGGNMSVDVYEGEHPLSFMNEPTYKSSIYIEKAGTVPIRYELRRDGSLVVSVFGKRLTNQFLPKGKLKPNEYNYSDPDVEYRNDGLMSYAVDVCRVLESKITLSDNDPYNICEKVDALVNKHTS